MFGETTSYVEFARQNFFAIMFNPGNRDRDPAV